jgi:uridine kinase
MGKVLVIGIAGGSGSGKTTLTHRLTKALGDDVTVLTHDSYYRAHTNMTYEELSELNFDHPDAYENDLLVRHLDALQRGKSVQRPVYDFAIHNRTEQTVTVEPSRVILIEGILIFANPALRSHMDLKIFVDAPADVRILRRLRRDVRERGRSIESVINQYLATVRPMHDAFVEPSKRYADIVVPTDGKSNLDAAVAAIAGYAKMRLQG